jgi:hypothetical protein
MLDRLRSDFQAGSQKVSSFQVLDDDLEPDRRGFKRSSVVLLDLEDDDFRAGRSPRRSPRPAAEDRASSVAAAAAILAEDRALSSSGAGSSQAEDSQLWLESSRESILEQSARMRSDKGFDKANKTDKWYCEGPDCGKDISLGTRKDGAFHRQRVNKVLGYYCPACYRNQNFVPTK